MIPPRPAFLGMASAHSPVVSEHPTLVMVERNKGDESVTLKSTHSLTVYCMVSCFLWV